jgi:hypothetical protein
VPVPGQLKKTTRHGGGYFNLPLTTLKDS